MAEIKKKKVSELEAAAELDSTDLLVVQQGSAARALFAGDLQNYCKKGAEQIESTMEQTLDETIAARDAAKKAQSTAESAATNAEKIASEVESNAEQIAQDAAKKATDTLTGYVNNAQTAKDAAQAAQTAAESARSAAANSAELAAAAKRNAQTAATDAQTAASEASTARGEAMSFSNKSLNNANNAKRFAENAADAAARAAASAQQAMGENVNWLATKIVTGGEVVIPQNDVTFKTSFVILSNTSGTLVMGETYTVTWRGVEYECVCKSGDGNYIGNGALAGEAETDDYPFCIMQYGEGAFTVSKSNSTPETITLSVISKQFVTYSALPDEHLPKSFPFIILRSSVAGSNKMFKLTVNDTGAMNIVEVS